MGTARSGSTILGVTLGNCEGVFYAGELGGWLEKSGVSNYAGEERARFWSGVLEQVDGAAELFGKETRRAVERSTAAFRVDEWPARRRLRRRFHRVTEELYRAIARASAAQYIVDTSSHPLRARELQKLAGVELYLVYLVRNPHSVVNSFTSPGIAQYSKSRLVTNAYIWLTHVLAVLVFLRQPRERRLFTRHEDFLGDPERVLRTVLLSESDRRRRCPTSRT